jgi:hypothetical protein
LGLGCKQKVSLAARPLSDVLVACVFPVPLKAAASPTQWGVVEK